VGVHRSGKRSWLYLVMVEETQPVECIMASRVVLLNSALYAASKILFGILFTSLGGLADFRSDHLPLVRLVFLNSIEESLTLVFRKLCIVHILIPVLLDTSLGSVWECLCYFCPTVSSIPHVLQPLFFRRCPRSICSTLLGRRWSHR